MTTKKKRPLIPINVDALRRWFSARGQRYIVLNVEHLRKIEPRYKEGLVEIVYRCDGHDFDSESQRVLEMQGPTRMLDEYAVNGYIKLPVEPLCDGRFSLAELAVVQQIVELYKDERMMAGAVAREEACECGGDPGCSICQGKGVVVVLDEMLDEEREMASGYHDKYSGRPDHESAGWSPDH